MLQIPSDEGDFNLQFFKDESFERRKCIKCGSYYWSQDRERKTCGDPPCDVYSFIGNAAGTKPMNVNMVRESFLGFFSDTHKIIKPYPIVPRWREDVLLVNASIYDFQPHVTSGLVKPPGNPLVMSQPCIRMDDVDSVGFTGRHLTSFEMLCHDSFNYPGNHVYWKNETVSYCYNFFTRAIGIDGKQISFKEKPWSGGGNAGAALEVFVKGLELATLVFMDLKSDPEGQFEIDGEKYSKMPLEVVDTGYGLERIAWVTMGSSTVYDAVFPEVIKFVKDHSGVNFADSDEMAKVTINGVSESYLSQSSDSDELIRYLRNAYIISDHSRSLVHLLKDYVIPSNVKVGYLERMLLRRIFRAADIINFTGNILDIMKMHIQALSGIIEDFPYKFAEEIITGEREKFQKNIVEGKAEVLRLLKRKKSIGNEDLQLLYDSSGMPPDLVREIANSEHVVIEIPKDFHSLIAARHKIVQKTGDNNIEIYPEIKTRPLYYDDTHIYDFNALVLFSNKNKIIPNQTAFYPTGGGQPNDLGYFVYKGKNVQVTNVEKKVESIVHTLETPIEKGSRIIGHIDVERRRRLMVHHSSTHLILGVMRSYLGEQVWQAGAQKGVESSRIDISYNRKLTEEDVREIERRCLLAIMENRKIKASFMDWNKATEKYGFRLFEGGVPLSSKLRVVEIEGVDIEGCGGTHLSNTGEIGIIKIISAESIQEGIQRIIFCAGKSALDYIQANYSQLNQIRKDTRITSEDVSNGVQKLTQENVDLRKRLELYIKTQAESLYASSQETTIGQHRWNLIHGNIDQDVYQFLIKYIMSKNTNFIILNEEDLTISVICREPSISKELLDSIPHNSIVKPSRFIKIELSRDQFSEYLKILK